MYMWEQFSIIKRDERKAGARWILWYGNTTVVPLKTMFATEGTSQESKSFQRSPDFETNTTLTGDKINKKANIRVGKVTSIPEISQRGPNNFEGFHSPRACSRFETRGCCIWIMGQLWPEYKLSDGICIEDWWWEWEISSTEVEGCMHGPANIKSPDQLHSPWAEIGQAGRYHFLPTLQLYQEVGLWSLCDGSVDLGRSSCWWKHPFQKSREPRRPRTLSALPRLS